MQTITSVEQLLGYARSILDQYGLTIMITAIVVIGTAIYVYDRFFRRD